MSHISVVQAPLRMPREIATRPGLLRGVAFDSTLIAANTAWALLAGVAVVNNPALFIPILVFDIWLLGYQHVVATYTRLVFDSESFARYRFLAAGLPVVVAVATFGAALSIGPWIVASTYLYWQWFHYTRQSYGIGRMYLRKIDAVPVGHDPVLFGVTYLAAALGHPSPLSPAALHVSEPQSGRRYRCRLPFFSRSLRRLSAASRFGCRAKSPLFGVTADAPPTPATWPLTS